METITEDYVSFEIAKMLKEKGFDEPCDNYYHQSSDEPQQLTLDEMYYSYDEFLKAPTHQMAMKWLREVHNIQIQITPIISRHKDWTFGIYKDFNPIDSKLQCFDTYEQACEEAIKYCLENLI